MRPKFVSSTNLLGYVFVYTSYTLGFENFKINYSKILTFILRVRTFKTNEDIIHVCEECKNHVRVINSDSLAI